jgi:hypothetical protein
MALHPRQSHRSQRNGRWLVIVFRTLSHNVRERERRTAFE